MIIKTFSTPLTDEVKGFVLGVLKEQEFEFDPNKEEEDDLRLPPPVHPGRVNQGQSKSWAGRHGELPTGRSAPEDLRPYEPSSLGLRATTR